MCGIVAVINKLKNGFSNIQLEVFESLLYIDGLRGLDSTGIILVDNIGNFSTLKGAVPVTGFIPDHDWGVLRTEAFRTGAAIIGHNRKATKGSVVDDNAHPFVINNELALVHNGTMYGDHKKYAKVEVDSHAIAHLLHEKGIQETIDEISAAYCFFWYDQRNDSINVLRNSQRPMFWIETDDAYYYASEASFLEFVIKRHSLKPVAKAPNEHPEFIQTSFTLKDKEWHIENKKYVPKPTEKPPTTSQVYQPKWSRVWPTDDDYQEPYILGRGTNYKRSSQDSFDWDNHEKTLAFNNKIYVPKANAQQWALKGGQTVHGMILDFVPVNYLDLREGYYLYFADATSEQEDPYLYKFKISGTGLNRNDLVQLVQEAAIYKLTVGTSRRLLECNQEFSCLVVNCISGIEITNDPVGLELVNE